MFGVAATRMESGSSRVILGLSLALSSLRYAPYLLVSLGGILDDILGSILIFLVVFSVSVTTTVAVEYCSCFVVLGLSVYCAIFGERYALLVICWF
jgi:hypothetical protein